MGRLPGLVRTLTIAFVSIVLVGAVTPVAVAVEAAPSINACRLLRVAEVQRILGPPAILRRGGTAAQCVVRGGSLLPIVSVATAGGTRTFRNLIRASGAPVKRLRGVGTEAVTYDYVLEDDVVRRVRGVIVRKGARVLQLSTNDVGPMPPGLPTVQQLTALARVAVRRL